MESKGIALPAGPGTSYKTGGARIFLEGLEGNPGSTEKGRREIRVNLGVQSRIRKEIILSDLFQFFKKIAGVFDILFRLGVLGFQGQRGLPFVNRPFDFFFDKEFYPF